MLVYPAYNGDLSQCGFHVYDYIKEFVGGQLFDDDTIARLHNRIQSLPMEYPNY